MSFFKQLEEQMAKAKEEAPGLDKQDDASLDRLINPDKNSPRPLFFHGSHNSHGDWGKHWARGDFEDEAPSGKGSDSPEETPDNSRSPSLTNR